MRWRNLLQSLPIWLLMIVMASQIYDMVRQYRSTYSSVMISRFMVDPGKCGFRTQQIGAVLSSGLHSFGSIGDANDVIVSRSANNEWRIAVQLKEPGTAAFEEEKRLLKPLVDCGKSTWCEGKAPLAEYGANSQPILERKRAGEQVDLPGCAITEAEFHPVDWELGKPPEGGVDALSLFTLAIEAASLYYLLRRPRTPVRTVAQ